MAHAVLTHSTPPPVLSAAPLAPGFVDLDERILARAGGASIARVATMEDGIAIASHAARRAAGVYDAVLVISSATPLWAEVSARPTTPS